MKVEKDWIRGFLGSLGELGYWSGEAQCESQAGEMMTVGINAFRLADSPATNFVALLLPDRKGHANQAAIAQLDLTWDDVRLLQLICVGLSNQEIAEALASRLDSVALHVKRLIAKLKIESRTEAAIKALRKRLVV